MPTPDDNLPLVAFIGAGRAASAIAPALEATGYRVVAVASRSTASAARLAAVLKGCKTGTAQEATNAADLVFITTQDAAIQGVAEQVDWRLGQSVVHCSGALTLQPLLAAQTQGTMVGSWHPLQTFTDRTPPADTLQGVTVGIEASGAMRDVLMEMARRVSAWPLEVPAAARALYHAAAVMSCGYMVTLLHEATSAWESAGLPREAALRALARLAETTLANVRSAGTRASLTGPAARGDLQTVRAHLTALEATSPQTVAVYRALGERSVALAGGGAEWEAILSPAEEV